MQNLRYALRQLRRSPVFSLTVLLTLAVGIGSATAIFSVVNSVLLQPFNFRDPGQLIVWRETIQEIRNRYPIVPANYRHFLYLKTHASTIDDAAILRNASFAVSVGTGHPQIVSGLSISPNLFSLLGAQPALGRAFLAKESEPGGATPVILSWSAWQRFFSADPNVIGRSLRMAGLPHPIIGVLPRSFSFPHIHEMSETANAVTPQPYEIFQPLVPQPDELNSDDGEFGLLAIARLKPGASAAQAGSELDGMQKAYSIHNHLQIHLGAVVEPFSEEVTGGVRKALWLLLASVVGVLLIACLNLAALQLARSVSRDRDNALRIALGANHLQLLQSSFTESLLLATCGGLTGLALAFLGVRFLTAIAPSDLPRLNEIHLSSTVLLFAFGTTVLTAIIFGLLPALRLFRTDPQQAFQRGSAKTSGSRSTTRTHSILVAFEVACTVTLLIFTFVTARSLGRVLTQNRAFSADRVTVAEANLVSQKYNGDETQASRERASFIDRALDRLGSDPGVESVAITSTMPLSGDTDIHSIYRKENPLPEDQTPSANLRNISLDYFKTLQIPLLSGAPFDAQERDYPIHAILSQNAANATWPGLNPLGRVFRINGRAYTVSGVAADARIANLKQDALVVYLPYWHEPPATIFFLVRSTGASEALVSAIRRELWQIDPEVAIPTIQTLDSSVNQSVAPERFQTVLLSSFGVAALALSLIGIYGILTYSVSLRRQEFGIRLALGSQKASLIRLVLTQGAYPVVSGLIVGVLAAAAVTRTLNSIFNGINGLDPLSIGASIALLLLGAFTAAILPAYRAAKVDPVQALNQN